jgi:hypothetical protein
MSTIQALLINIGSNTNEKNGVAPIHNDGTFEYWPIEESNPGQRTPRFKDLSVNCSHSNLRTHYDPRFKPTPTYGDIRDAKAFRSLAAALEEGNQPLLLFAASLRYSGPLSSKPSWIPSGIGYYIIGFFIVKEIRFSSDKGTLDWCGHEHNAHYLRPSHDEGNVKLIVGGTSKSRLLKRAFPISIRSGSGLQPFSWLKANFRELRGGPIGKGPWYRRTLRNAESTLPKSILKEIARHEISQER